jgi:hypothetical protein
MSLQERRHWREQKMHSLSQKVRSPNKKALKQRLQRLVK